MEEVEGEEEVVLAGGNVGGAVRVGNTVRRPTGPWTPAVHALLRHLASHRLPGIPAVLGHDDAGREVLTYLPGRVIDINSESLTPGQLVSLIRWTRALHQAVVDFRHAGPWRFFPVPTSLIAEHSPFMEFNEFIGHNDIAPLQRVFRW